MPLSTSEKRKIRKHLGYLSTYEQMDSKFVQIDADSAWLTDAQAQISTCDTRLTNYETAMAAADEIRSGMGASLNHNIPITKKMELYKQAVDELSRLVEFPVLKYLIDNNEEMGVSGYYGGC